MWNELEPKLIQLTPSLAEKHQAMEHLEGDRDVTSTTGKNRIKWLDTKLQNKQFFTPTWAVALLNDKWYRVDGGHSSAMLCNANGHFPSDKQVLLRRFECASLEDLTDLYNQFDNSKSRRTLADKAKASASIHGNIKDIRATWITKAIAGIVFYLSDGSIQKLDEDERIAYIHSDADFIEWAHVYVKTKHMGSPGAIAAMYRGHSADPNLTTEFWDMVKDESHPNPDHPTRLLSRYLQECHFKGNNRRVVANSHFYSPRARYCKSIHAWNAWQHNQTTALKYTHNAGIPTMWIVDAGGNARSI